MSRSSCLTFHHVLISRFFIESFHFRLHDEEEWIIPRSSCLTFHDFVFLPTPSSLCTKLFQDFPSYFTILDF
jgi:hypothetical protein